MKISIRASSLSEFMDCQVRFKAKQLDGITMKWEKSPEAIIGSAVHLAVGYFDGCMINDADVTISDATEIAIEYVDGEWVEADFNLPSSELERAKRLATESVMAYCWNLATSGHGKQTFAVEPKLPPVTLHLSDIDVEITGTPDRIYRVDHAFGIRDIKTGARAFDIQGRAPQLGIYELIATQAGFNISLPSQIISIGKPSSIPAPITRVTNVTNAQEIAAYGNDSQPGLISAVARAARSDFFLGNPRSSLCSEKFCPIYPCHFVEKTA